MEHPELSLAAMNVHEPHCQLLPGFEMDFELLFRPKAYQVHPLARSATIQDCVEINVYYFFEVLLPPKVYLNPKP